MVFFEIGGWDLLDIGWVCGVGMQVVGSGEVRCRRERQLRSFPCSCSVNSGEKSEGKVPSEATCEV